MASCIAFAGLNLHHSSHKQTDCLHLLDGFSQGKPSGPGAHFRPASNSKTLKGYSLSTRRVISASYSTNTSCRSHKDGIFYGNERLSSPACSQLEKSMVEIVPVASSIFWRVVAAAVAFLEAARTFQGSLVTVAHSLSPMWRTMAWGDSSQTRYGELALAASSPLPLLFFAAMSTSSTVKTPLTVVASGMAKWLELYSGVLLIRVLLSWFPNIDWERQPMQAMRDMCDPYLNLFRNILPPFFGALDLSPMLAFLVLGILTSILNTTIYS
eukprot:TRINITY_DN3290_c0_g1_i4.p1 TRINITY_DN3290_c0_g1~~TRINITY_DN3290_c0_g1_i4.p1  ORF type:complete len:269 (-),score=38.09 TRINITY_DN3290_c0_g1_i4:71-877(-)